MIQGGSGFVHHVVPGHATCCIDPRHDILAATIIGIDGLILHAALGSCTCATTGVGLGATGLLILVLGTILITGHSNIVDNTIRQSIYIDTVGSNMSLAASISGLLVFQLRQGMDIIGNNTRAHANSAATGAHHIAHDANSIRVVGRSNIYCTAGGNLVHLGIIVIFVLFRDSCHLFARSKYNIVIHQGFGVRCAAHVGDHACQTTLTGLGTTQHDA